MIEKARNKGMRFYALGIGDVEIFKRENEFDKNKIEGINFDGWGFGGYGFFNNCDYRFIYDDGRCREMKKEKN